MIAHSICQDGCGFPYLSPTCYSYLIGGEDRALELVSLEDLPADSASVVSLVCENYVLLKNVLQSHKLGLLQNYWSTEELMFIQITTPE